MIRHSTFPLLLLLLLLCFSVAASNAFVPRRHRRYKTEASSRPLIDSSQSLHQRDAILPFGLRIRGGDMDLTSEAVENDVEATNESADSGDTATKGWEEEIKRTQSFYQEQSVNNDTVDEDGANNVDEDSDTFPAVSDRKAVSTEEGDESDPVQTEEDIVDVVEVKEDTEDNTEEVEEVNQVEEEVIAQVDATEIESGAEVCEEEQEEVAKVEEALQVEVDAEGQSSESGEVGAVDTEENVPSEEIEVTNVVEVSNEAVTEEVAGGEEVVAGEIADEVDEVSEGDQATAMEENAGSDKIVDASETLVVAADDEEVAEGDADAAAIDEASEYTSEQDASSVAVTDEPTSLVRKASALVQVILLRGRIAVSKTKGVQYLAQNKPKIKVIALASLGGVLSLLVGGHVLFAMQEAGTSEIPHDEWIEEEMIYADDTDDEKDNDY